MSFDSSFSNKYNSDTLYKRASFARSTLDGDWRYASFIKDAVCTDYNLKNIGQQCHLYHLVEPSGWPFVSSLALCNYLFSFFLYVNYNSYFFSSTLFYAYLSLSLVLLCAGLWFYEVIVESVYLGKHTSPVSMGLRIGMVLFIVSEVVFFVSFFWAFFHSSLVPVYQIGSVWPPINHALFVPTAIPLLNTFILLYSGITVTWAHKAIVNNQHFTTTVALVFTLIAAVGFTWLQGIEYTYAPFNLSDSIYSTMFFLTTGFHGFHVIIGSIFLTVCFVRHLCYHYTAIKHVGLESAIWYWHFVDVVWLFVYFFFYLYI